MRYVITQSQFHSLIYNYLGSMYSNKDFRKKVNPFVSSGKSWNIDMFNNDGKRLISYYWDGPGEYDDGTPHNGVGSLLVNPTIVNSLMSMFSIRQSKVLDIVADWVSETLNVDIDEISIYPETNY